MGMRPKLGDKYGNETKAGVSMGMRPWGISMGMRPKLGGRYGNETKAGG